jgi:hypothetical protein
MGAAQQLISGTYGNRFKVVVFIRTDTLDYIASIAKLPLYVAGKTDAVFVINAGVTVGSGFSGGSAALYVIGGWDPGDTVTVINNGTIVGVGGNGGNGASVGPNGVITPATNGEVGGTAVEVNTPITFVNNGMVAAGGGGGGGGAAAAEFTANVSGTNCYVNCGGSGGGSGAGGAGAFGGGRQGGFGGAAVDYSALINQTAISFANGKNGNSGTSTVAGTGGAMTYMYSLSPNVIDCESPVAGSGGGLGDNGVDGSDAISAGPGGIISIFVNGGAGGSTGYCLYGKSNVNGGAGITGGVTFGPQLL